MIWYVTKRLLQLIPVILGVTIIAFSLIHIAPGDPARTMLGQHATQKEINEINEKYGLDEPVIVQYGIWLSGVIRGDFGRSIITNELVIIEIAERMIAIRTIVSIIRQTIPKINNLNPSAA